MKVSPHSPSDPVATVSLIWKINVEIYNNEFIILIILGGFMFSLKKACKKFSKLLIDIMILSILIIFILVYSSLGYEFFYYSDYRSDEDILSKSFNAK